MILLLFFVLIIQFFTYWIFEPLASFLAYLLEIRLFPIFGLLLLILFQERTLKKMQVVQISNKQKTELIKQKTIIKTLMQFLNEYFALSNQPPIANPLPRYYSTSFSTTFSPWNRSQNFYRREI